MARPALVTSGLALALVVAATPAVAQRAGAHQHGVVKLNLAVDASAVSLAMEAPLESLLGFERAPRNDAERRAANALIDRLRSGPALITLDPAAQCAMQRVTVDAPVLAPGAKADAGDHADIEATYTFDCKQPSALRSLDLTALLDAYKRIARVELQVAGASGQTKQVLRRPNTVLRWGR